MGLIMKNGIQYPGNVSSGGESSYTLPIASTETLGGIKVGENLSITEDGTLNAIGGGGGGSYTLPPATSENLGGVIVGSGLSVEQSGKISVNVDAALSETSENPVQNKLITARMNEVFQSVSDGKSKIAAAITDKGINTAADATFNTMANNISKIETGSSIQKDNTKILYNKVILNAIECTVEVIKNVD